MLALDELKTSLTRVDGFDALDQGLDFILASGSTDELLELSAWSLDRALISPDSERYGVWMMLAGAARTNQNETRDERKAGELLAVLSELQDKIDAGLDPRVGLGEFGKIFADVALDGIPEYLDMELRTDPDDSVHLWTSGVCAMIARKAIKVR